MPRKQHDRLLISWRMWQQSWLTRAILKVCGILFNQEPKYRSRFLDADWVVCSGSGHAARWRVWRRVTSGTMRWVTARSFLPEHKSKYYSTSGFFMYQFCRFHFRCTVFWHKWQATALIKTRAPKGTRQPFHNFLLFLISLATSLIRCRSLLLEFCIIYVCLSVCLSLLSLPLFHLISLSSLQSLVSILTWFLFNLKCTKHTVYSTYCRLLYP